MFEIPLSSIGKKNRLLAAIWRGSKTLTSSDPFNTTQSLISIRQRHNAILLQNTVSDDQRGKYTVHVTFNSKLSVMLEKAVSMRQGWILLGICKRAAMVAYWQSLHTCTSTVDEDCMMLACCIGPAMVSHCWHKGNKDCIIHAILLRSGKGFPITCIKTTKQYLHKIGKDFLLLA